MLVHGDSEKIFARFDLRIDSICLPWSFRIMIRSF